ncbi:MAG: hypothetical protein HY782_00425 [Chloroflexi bacterium]|nr:hypothetical protein [Chloroflexota bacterium]
MSEHISGALKSKLAKAIVLVALLLVLVTISLSRWPSGNERRIGAVRTFYLFATDGFLISPSGERVRFYGLVGGLQNAPMTYRADDGSVKIIPEGPPAPTAGAITPSEAALVGQAQYPGPIIWAEAGDLVEIRFKNLGGSSPDAPSDPIGIELRGLNALGQEAAVPETARLAIPVQPGDPESGNVVVYLFSPSRPGTFAYGAMGDMANMSGMSGMTGMMGCMCCMGTMGSMDMTEMGGAPEMKLDGALIVYNLGDPAARGGPNSDTGGELASERFDQEWLVVLPALQTQAGSASSRPQDSPWQPLLIPAGQRVLLRTINPSMGAQVVKLDSSRYDVIAYRRNPLEWSITRMDMPGWLRPDQLDWLPGRSVLVGAGEAYDWLIVFK